MTTPTSSRTEHSRTDSPRWQHGRVAWFDAEQGFGFLDPDDGGESVFVRRDAVAAPWHRTLFPGERVVFTAIRTDHRPEATQVLTYPGIPASPVRPPVRRRDPLGRMHRIWRGRVNRV